MSVFSKIHNIFLYIPVYAPIYRFSRKRSLEVSSLIAGHTQDFQKKTRFLRKKSEKYLNNLFSLIRSFLIWIGSAQTSVIYLYFINRFILSWFTENLIISKYLMGLAWSSPIYWTNEKCSQFTTSSLLPISSSSLSHLSILSKCYMMIPGTIGLIVFISISISSGMLYSRNSAVSLKNTFRISEVGFLENPLTLLELIAADIVHIMPLVALGAFGLLALPEVFVVLAFFSGFVVSYRGLLIFNIIFSGTPVPDQALNQKSTVKDAFTKSENNITDRLYNNDRVSLFFPQLYSKIVWNDLIQTKIDPYSKVIRFPIEEYPLLARGYKGIHMVVTAPFLLIDFFFIVFQNKTCTPSHFTRFPEVKKCLINFAQRIDYMLPDNMPLGFCETIAQGNLHSKKILESVEEDPSFGAII